MPELPEVETIARGLHQRLAGQRIESLRLASYPKLFLTRPARLKQSLTGVHIENFHREGKHIVGELTGPRGESMQWLIHLGMTGRCLVTSPDAPCEPHTHLIARTSGGVELRFVDPRRFGRIRLFEGKMRFTPAGLEPTTVSLEDFLSLFHGRRTPIKSALLNQSLLTGIGNIYADESLHRALIRPRRQCVRITRAEYALLHAAIREVLAEAIAAGGSSVNDYVDATGTRGLFQFSHRVYQRTGEPCPACGTAIARVVIAGRSSHFCPRCQR